MIVVNCYPIVYLTKKLLKKMILRQKKSAIINLSSVMGQYPTGYAAVYSATKAFDDFFSRSLH